MLNFLVKIMCVQVVLLILISKISASQRCENVLVRQGTFSLEAEEGWCWWSSIPHTQDYLKGLGFLTNATPGEPQFLHNCPF